MRNASVHLLGEKMDETVTHYMNSHPQGEGVHGDGSSLSLNIHDEGRVVTVMQSQVFSSQMTRHVAIGEQVENGPWSEELLDPEMRLAALVAHLAHQSRSSHHQSSHHKISSVRDVDSSVILDTPLRLFNGQPLESQSEPIVVQVPSLPSLPPLQDMKRCQTTDWFHNKDKTSLKESAGILVESDQSLMDIRAGASPAQNKQQNKKSLPHKKRISRKLKRNTGGSTPQQDIVVINCSDEVPHEEILPDNFVNAVQHQEHLTEDTHHIAHEMRPILICQLCGEFYGEEQLKFFHHLKQHYEPHGPGAIIIENPVADLAIDKMANTCIVDNGATLPDSIVELSLENTVPKSYQTIDKHILYSSSDKTLYTNKVQYSMASMDKEPLVPTADKADIYETLDRLEMFSCLKCNKTFRKQKQCETHIKEAHSKQLEEMSEFSEPEDLMEGIHVSVEEAGEPYEQTLLPHLTVENGQVHQEHVRHWYVRSGGGGLASCGDGSYCPVCPAPPPPPPPPPPVPAPRPHPAVHHQHQPHLKEEVLQRIFESEVPSDLAVNIIHEQELPPEPEPEPQPEPEIEPTSDQSEDTKPDLEDKKMKGKKYECPQCGRVFYHRNSLLYHILSHRGKQFECEECGKEFYTANALKVHKRVHNGDRPYKCEECGREFRQWSDLKYHKVSLHTAQKHFKCEYCGKEFARKYSLSVHRRIHTGEKNYKCTYCNKTFRASSYRLAHMRTHTGDRPYKCSVCEKCFRVAGDLRRHMLTHDKVRARPADKKKEEKKVAIKIEVKPPTEPAQKIKKIAVASTTRPPHLKSTDRKIKLVKKAPLKKGGGAPNITVTQRSGAGAGPGAGEQFKMAADYQYDTRQEYSKFKEVYSEPSVEYNKDLYKVKEYSSEMINYKDNDQDRELAVLRPIFRGGGGDDADKPPYKLANTDGKMQVYTHVEKGHAVSVAMDDIRGLERERATLPPAADGIEHGFLENLTALYNIPAV